MPDLFFADLVRETSTGTGTGALILAGATPGHRRFADAVLPGARFHYAIAGVTHEAQWEVGEGELADGALVRDVVLASSSGSGEAVELAPGLKTVTLTVAADWFAARDDRAGHHHDVEQIDGLAEALAAKQPAGSYAAAAHTHDYLPRDADGNWIASEGRLGVGSLAPYNRLEVRGASMAGYSFEISGTLDSPSGTQIYLGDDNFHHPSYWNSAPGIGAIIDPTGVAGTLALAAYGGLPGSRSLVATASHSGYASRALAPGDDAMVLLGRPGLRWSDIHAVSGTINTSDARDKLWLGGMDARERRAGLEILAELGFFQWTSAIDAKGVDAARRHFGVRAQSAFAIMERHGLDWRRYGWCCHDRWDDAEGSHERYGIRADQLCLFLMGALAGRFDSTADESPDAAR